MGRFPVNNPSPQETETVEKMLENAMFNAWDVPISVPVPIKQKTIYYNIIIHYTYLLNL